MEEENSNNKFSIIMAVLIILAVVAYFVFPFGEKAEEVEAYEFFGQVQNVEGDIVYMNGQYMNTATIFIGEEVVSVQVEITPETKLIKELIYLPNDELSDPGELQREVVEGSVNDLIENEALGFITIKTNENILGDLNIVASEINYPIEINSESE